MSDPIELLLAEWIIPKHRSFPVVLRTPRGGEIRKPLAQAHSVLDGMPDLLVERWLWLPLVEFMVIHSDAL
jgi:hypothetical protein